MLRIPEIIDLDKKKKFVGNLLICPTPIGNLEDLTIRNYKALTEADIIVCEDTRRTGKLLKLLQEKKIGKQITEFDVLQKDSLIVDDQFESEEQKDDEFFEDFEKKELERHPNMKSYKRLKEKIRDQRYIDDVRDVKKKGEILQRKLDTYGFLKSAEDQRLSQSSKMSGDLIVNDESDMIFSNTKANKSIMSKFAPESEFFDGMSSDVSKAHPSYGLHSEFIEFSKSKILESKARHGRGILISCHKFNEKERLSQIIRLLRAGMTIVLTSDAGSPALSDPGQILIDEALKENVEVESLPGANAITTSLAASGFPADEFFFIGYIHKELPKKEKQLRRAKHLQISTVVFENKNRLVVTLMNLERIFGEEQQIYVGVELTKLHQRQIRGNIKYCLDLLNKNPDFTVPSVKGEVTIVISPFTLEYNSMVRDDKVKEIGMKQGLSQANSNVKDNLYTKSKEIDDSMFDFVKIEDSKRQKQIQNLEESSENKNMRRSEELEYILMRQRKYSVAEIIKILNEELDASTNDLAHIINKITGESKKECFQAISYFKEKY
jgi:16S rRNA (cytidine1402-2'-O)-methyltransferase